MISYKSGKPNNWRRKNLIKNVIRSGKCVENIWSSPILVWYLSSHDILEIRDYYATGVSWLNVIFFLPGKLKVLYKLYDVWCSVTHTLFYNAFIAFIKFCILWISQISC
jgi:hypothetical protein